MFGLASCSCPLTTLEGLPGFGGRPAEPGVVASDPVLRFSMEMPRPLLEPLLEFGRLCDEARRPADRIAASSSRLLGSWICGGASAFLGDGCLPQKDAADFTEGAASSEFSLSSSALGVGSGRFAELKPPNSGTSLFAGVEGAGEGLEKVEEDFAGVSGFCGSRSSGWATRPAGFAGVAGLDDGCARCGNGDFLSEAVIRDAAEPEVAARFQLGTDKGDSSSLFGSGSFDAMVGSRAASLLVISDG